ncbi:MAG: flagellar export chaperone FliS [Proteobacteria bacterium]|nr:flagellar export chaperone FliS [Pseudomonadota bacterium]
MLKANYQQKVYRRTHVETANPGRILLTLYDAAIRFVRLASQQIKSGNAAAKGVTLGKAYAIIAEFIHALDHDKAPELCRNLEMIYGFMLEQMSEANAKMDAAPLEPVITHLVDLRETWGKAVSKAAIDDANKNKAASL